MVYFDNAATTQPDYFAEDYSWAWGNSNSPHGFGMKARQQLEVSREGVKACLGVSSGKVIFGHSASQLLSNFALCGLNSFCNKKEHDSVYSFCYDLNKLNPNYHTPKAVFHQYVNQLSGEVYDIESIGKQAKVDGYFFCSDFTAAIGKVRIPKNLDKWCDMVVFSAHKLHGPKGVGIMWVSDNLAKHLGLSKDSKNEYGFYHGTTDVPAIMASVQALVAAQCNVDAMEKHSTELLDHLEKKLIENGINYHLVWNEHKTNAINLITLYGINADALVQYLSTKEIYISPAASACAENHDYRVAMALGLSKEEAEQSVRVSFSLENTLEDVDKFVDGVKKFKEMFV